LTCFAKQLKNQTHEVEDVEGESAEEVADAKGINK
jgi:hypothetical protein